MLQEDYAWAASMRSTRSPNNCGPNVFVHVKGAPNAGDWVNVLRRFMRVPTVGEYLQLDDGIPYVKVEVVLHIPFNEKEIAAEIWCSRAPDQNELLRDFAARSEDAKRELDAQRRPPVDGRLCQLRQNSNRCRVGLQRHRRIAQRLPIASAEQRKPFVPPNATSAELGHSSRQARTWLRVRRR